MHDMHDMTNKCGLAMLGGLAMIAYIIVIYF